MVGEAGRVVEFLTALAAGLAYFNYPAVDPNLRAVDVPSNQLRDQYDFIIVGAGSAGSVLANRLTEVAEWTVLLLEYGHEETVFTDTPLLCYDLWNSVVDWNYTTTRQPNACYSYDGYCRYPRGRVIGGSSTLNFMVYSRGNRRDYDRWAAMGNEGWSYAEVMPYFLLSEDNQNEEYIQNGYHNVGGYLTVSEPSYHTPLRDAFLQGGEQIGFGVGDCNGPRQTGFMRVQGTLRNGSRCSTGKAYLRPVRNRTNLHVAEGAYVTKVNFEGTKAVSVTFVRDNQQITIKANKEVIMSAGAVNTPKILMLSGVGPTDQLQQFNIPIIKNLSVGLNLQDHQGAPLFYAVNPPVSIAANDYESADAIYQYAQPSGGGPLTVPGGIESVAFLNTSFSDPSLDYPDVEIHFSSLNLQLTSDQHVWFGLGLILHPLSRGRVTLQSSNPFEIPLINTNYFDVPQDLEVAVQVLKYVNAVANSKALQEFNSTLVTSYYPTCLQYQVFSDEFFRCIVQTNTTTIFHPSCTCKMGPNTDPEAVVDSRLRIYGLQNIRVIDTSVMPAVTGGNTNAPTIMIAEKGADLIKADYGKPTHIPPNFSMNL